jgi:hypothetical protein
MAVIAMQGLATKPGTAVIAVQGSRADLQRLETAASTAVSAVRGGLRAVDTPVAVL